MSGETHGRGEMSLDEILARLNQLEASAHSGFTEPAPERTTAPQPERIESLPRNQPLIDERLSPADAAAETATTETPAADPVAEPVAEQRPVAPSRIADRPTSVPPPAVPKPPADGTDTRYGRVTHKSRWPKSTDPVVSEPTATHDPAPDPIDIRFNEEDDVFVESTTKQTKQIDVKRIMLAAVYLGIVLLAIAVAIYI